LAKELYHAVGRRKSAVARVFLSEGKGKVIINNKAMDEYLKRDSLKMTVKQPFSVTETEGKYDVKASVKGGGLSSQAGALRLGIARAMLDYDESYKKVLKKDGLLTRDPRRKERKKYGQPGRRKKFQFSKR
jgi:small subunit ribosomal protein S9